MIGVVKLSRSETWSHERVDYRYVRQLSSYHGDLTLGALPDTIFFSQSGRSPGCENSRWVRNECHVSVG
jgi:hypothetical protein